MQNMLAILFFSVHQLRRERDGRGTNGRTTFQCVIVLMACERVRGVLSSEAAVRWSPSRRLRRMIFSEGVRKVTFSGRGTMRKNEAIARRIVKSPSIMKTLGLSA